MGRGVAPGFLRMPHNSPARFVHASLSAYTSVSRLLAMAWACGRRGTGRVAGVAGGRGGRGGHW